MDEQNKGVNERWAPPGRTPERGYTRDESATPSTGTTGARADERSTREIRSEIEQTRAEMGETIDEIQDRLRPADGSHPRPSGTVHAGSSLDRLVRLQRTQSSASVGSRHLRIDGIR